MNKDKSIIRELAKKVSEISALPEQEKKRELWYRHNELKGEKPLILIFPENSWNELIPESGLLCEDETARRIEAELKRRIYYHEHLRDDAPVEAEFAVSKCVNQIQHDWLPPGDWGIEIKKDYNAAHDMYVLKQSIDTIEDLERLAAPKLYYDEAATIKSYEKHKELIGDILPVKIKGYSVITFHLMKMYSSYRGLNQMYMDFYENPDFVHRFMRILTDGYFELMDDALNQGLIEINNNGCYVSSGGKGYSKELPQADFKGAVRRQDLWASAESQELSGVSPSMHKEFTLEYEKEILAPFGLNGYGCCEPLQNLIDDIIEIPNIRRISISPFADYKLSAERLGGRAIFSFKSKPTQLVGTFDKTAVYQYIKDVVEVCDANGCKPEIILKDTHTCENHPERFDLWLEAAREAIGG